MWSPNLTIYINPTKSQITIFAGKVSIVSRGPTFFKPWLHGKESDDKLWEIQSVGEEGEISELISPSKGGVMQSR